jgi:hypothetical protein
MNIWYILCSFGKLYLVVVYTKKNLASLEQQLKKNLFRGKKIGALCYGDIFMHYFRTNQDDQIGLIFAFWAIAHFGQFYRKPKVWTTFFCAH